MSALVLLVIKPRKDIQSIRQNIHVDVLLSNDMLIHYLQEKKAKGTMLFSKIFIHSCTIIHYTTEESIFLLLRDF